LDFADESYVRKYPRKTLTSRLLGWDGRAVMDAMLGKFDAAGLFAIRGDAATCISVVTEIPLEFVKEGLRKLVETETWIVGERVITWPTYEEAQNCKRSDRVRQRESRRARSLESVTTCHKPSRDSVTNVTTGHSPSRNVTLPPSAPSLSSPPPSLPLQEYPERTRTPSEPKHPGPLKQTARDFASADPTGGAPALKHEWDPDWLPALAHQARGIELGLNDDDIGDRLRDCQHKPFPRGFKSEDHQFYRELKWAADEKTIRKAKEARSGANWEKPGHQRQSRG
jgi:hypothetical protein